ncbi:MAG: nucleotidyltransferase [Clostridia bacterium]|nr:nucleotidyltransferase [Clostridia bacterium]
MQKPTLLVLAAGMGSRYGGLKQIDPLGPHGEIILDYSLYDALLSGFGKVVFLIKQELFDTFRQGIGRRFENRMEVDYAFQELCDLPEGFSAPEGRVKPWGTGHAVYAARNKLKGAFGVIGSDDFFGRDTFSHLGAFCARECDGTHLGMVGFRLCNTLSENGSVSRGVCVCENGFLRSVTERTAITKEADGRIVFAENGEIFPLEPETPVSMNVWAMHADLFPAMETDFARWLAQESGDPMKREYYLPAFFDRIIRQGAVTVKVMDTASKWYGVTNREDKPAIQRALAAMHENGLYPPLL